MAVDYMSAENYKHKVKRFGVTLAEYLLLVMIDKLDAVKKAVNWTRGLIEPYPFWDVYGSVFAF